jgi:hypothetical protein
MVVEVDQAAVMPFRWSGGRHTELRIAKPKTFRPLDADPEKRTDLRHRRRRGTDTPVKLGDYRGANAARLYSYSMSLIGLGLLWKLVTILHKLWGGPLG